MSCQLSIDGSSIRLEREEMSQLNLPGRQLFGPMTRDELATARAICVGLMEMAKSANAPATLMMRLCNHSSALESEHGPNMGPQIMQTILVKISAEIEALKAAEQAKKE